MADQTTPTMDLTQYREQYSYYAKRLLSDLGLGDVPQPERGELLASIERYVEQVLTNTLLENLDDVYLEQVETIIERGGGHDEVAVYLLTNIPNIDVKIADAMAQSYALMLEETKQMAAGLASQHIDSLRQNTPQQEDNTDSNTGIG